MKIWDVENNFYLNTDVTRINKLLCQFELFKKTIKVPGDIVECGVFKGASFVRLLTYRNLLIQNKKKVIGFDAFGKFPKQSIKEDQKFAVSHDRDSGLGVSVAKFKKILKRKRFKRFELIKGDIKNTIPIYLNKNKNLKISFLHLDMDVFEPTKIALNYLFQKVSKNGIILIDDYNNVRGATKATNYFLKNRRGLKIQKLKFNKRLSYLVK